MEYIRQPLTVRRMSPRSLSETAYAIRKAKPTGKTARNSPVLVFIAIHERLRRMQLFLLLFFIAVPVAEIALFIQAGQLIGTLPTIAITVATAIAGSFLMRVQGFAALKSFGDAVDRGEMPLTPVIDGIGILSAGLLLLTPGLLTDTIGLLLFVPPIRRSLARWAFSRAAQSGTVSYSVFGQSGQSGGTKPNAGAAGPDRFRKPGNDNVVDAEFETIHPGSRSEKGEPLEPDETEGRPRSRKDTPWRP